MLYYVVSKLMKRARICRCTSPRMTKKLHTVMYITVKPVDVQAGDVFQMWNAKARRVYRHRIDEVLSRSATAIGVIYTNLDTGVQKRWDMSIFAPSIGLSRTRGRCRS